MIDELLTIDEIVQLGHHLALYDPLSSGLSAFHASLKDFRWLFGGNQSGKSYANMMDLAMMALGIHPYRITPKNAVYWVATETFEMVRDNIWEAYLSNFIPANRIKRIDWGSGKVPRKVHIDNGVTIEFKAFNQGRITFQSRKIDGFYGDEQCLRDYTGMFDEICARLLVKKGFISWSMTPIIPQIDLEKRIERLPLTDETFYLDLNDNRSSEGGYLDDERIDEQIDNWPDESYCTRVEGKFGSFHGSVYQSFNRSTHMIKPFEIPEDWELYRGIDFGFAEMFACLWMAKDGDGNWYVYREYTKRRKVVNEHIENIKTLSGDEEYRCTIADPEDAEGREQFRKAGISTVTAKKSIDLGVECVQGKLKVKENGKPSLYIFNDCPETLAEFAVYRYPDKPGKNKPLKENDHCMDVIRYILFTMLKPRKKGKVWIA